MNNNQKTVELAANGVAAPETDPSKIEDKKDGDRGNRRGRKRRRKPGNHQDYVRSMHDKGKNDVTTWKLKGLTDTLGMIQAGIPSGSQIPNPFRTPQGTINFGEWTENQSSQPGVMVFDFIPNLGFGIDKSTTLQIGVNAQEMILRLRGTGAVPYNASDIYQYYMGVASVFVTTYQMIRLYRLINNTKPRNRYWGIEVGKALGYDIERIMFEGANFTVAINAIAKLCHTLPLPDVIGCLDEWLDEVTYVYKDSESERAGYYAMNVPGMWLYRWDLHKTVFLSWTDLVAELGSEAGVTTSDLLTKGWLLNPWAILKIVRAIINRYVHIPDIAKMGGDLLSLYGGRRLLAMVEVILSDKNSFEPILNWERLQQFENAQFVNTDFYAKDRRAFYQGANGTWVPKFALRNGTYTASGMSLAEPGYSIVMEQDSNNDLVTYAMFGAFSASDVADTYRLATFNYLNFRSDDPSVDEVLLNTRYVTRYDSSSRAISFPLNVTFFGREIKTCGTSAIIAAHITTIGYQRASGGGVYGTYLGDLETMFSPLYDYWGFTVIKVTVDESSNPNPAGFHVMKTNATMRSKWFSNTLMQSANVASAFDYCPFCYYENWTVAFGVSETDTAYQVASTMQETRFRRIGEFDVIYAYSYEWLKQLNDNIILAVVWMPNLAIAGDTSGQTERNSYSKGNK